MLLGNCISICDDDLYTKYKIDNNIYCCDIFPNGIILSAGPYGAFKIWNTVRFIFSNCKSIAVNNYKLNKLYLTASNNPINCITILPDERILIGLHDSKFRI